MNELQIFNNEEFGEVRVVNVNGEPWFVASDVCKVLELSNPSMATDRLDEDERSKFNLGRQGEANIVNEYGLYSLVMVSKKPKAKKFKRWITHEVLPQIRKTGSYQSKPMTIPEQIRLLAQGNVELEKKVDAVDKRIDTLEQDMPLYGCEIDEVKGHVNRKGVKVLGGKQSEAYKDASIRGSVYSDIYSQLKREYGCVSSYKSIKRKYIADVHEFIDCYEPPTVLAEQINGANAQISF